MGWRGTLALALLVAVAATVFLLSPKPKEPLPDSTTLLGEPRFLPEDAATAQKLIQFSAADIVRMSLGFRDEVVTVARDGDHWKGAADDRRLNEFLNSVADTTVINSLEENQGELRDYGLDAPSRRLLLEDEKGQSVVLLLGERNPAGTAVYVRANDGPVSIAGALLVWEFDKAFAAITGRKPIL